MQNAFTIAGLGESVSRAAEFRQAQQDAQSSADFTQLVELHSRLLYRIAFAILRNPADAEDAVQETFLQLHNSGRLEQVDDPKSYLARIVWRNAVRRSPSRPEPQELPDNLESHAPNPEKSSIQLQMESQMHALIDRLPEKLRQPLALSALGDLSQVEIARVLRLPEGTIRRRIHTARQQLRQQWEKRRGGKA
jgi:RNA polymerase sigma-70 factor (ECF subfamily)